MTKILGIDYGRKRIGIAIGDTDIRIASPLTTVAGRNDATRDARNVADLGQAEGAGAFVVGLPVPAGGGETPQTELMRRFAAELARLSGKPVELEDEHLTSYAAEEVLKQSGLRHKRRKALTDRLAAQHILQSFLDRLGKESG